MAHLVYALTHSLPLALAKHCVFHQGLIDLALTRAIWIIRFPNRINIIIWGGPRLVSTESKLIRIEYARLPHLPLHKFLDRLLVEQFVLEDFNAFLVDSDDLCGAAPITHIRLDFECWRKLSPNQEYLHSNHEQKCQAKRDHSKLDIVVFDVRCCDLENGNGNVHNRDA